MTTPLDYKTPTPPVCHLSFRASTVGGVIAGALTFGCQFLIGTTLDVGVGCLVGIVLSAVVARASRGFEFTAGLVASAFAAGSWLIVGIVCSSLIGPVGVELPDIKAIFIFAIWWVVFALPGLLGSLWVWEGRRNADRFSDAP